MRWILHVATLGALAGMTQDAQGQEPTTRLEDTGKELIIEVGPIHLPVQGDSTGQDHEHAGILPPIGTVTIPTDGYFYGFDYEVVDGDGNQLPTSIVHHFNVIDPDHRELFLPISRRVMAAGGETGGQSMPWMLFGYPMSAGQRLVVSVMLHNPTGVEHHDVALRIRLKYVNTGRPWPLFKVYPYQLDVAFPAGDKSFDLPLGESSRSYEASPAVAGRLMVMASHMHEYATRIVFEDITENEIIWEGFPVAEESQLSGVTIGRLYKRFGVKIFPDHRYRVTVHYTNPTGEAIAEGGMGVVAGLFMPARGEEWPAAEPDDPLYALDRDHYMQVVRGKYDLIKDGGGKISDMMNMKKGMDHSHN